MGSTEGGSEYTLYRYQFANAEFDEARLELRVGGTETKLETRSRDILLELLRHDGEVVQRGDLLRCSMKLSDGRRVGTQHTRL